MISGVDVVEEEYLCLISGVEGEGNHLGGEGNVSPPHNFSLCPLPLFPSPSPSPLSPHAAGVPHLYAPPMGRGSPSRPPSPSPSPLSPLAAGVPHLRHLGVGDLAFTGGPAVAVAPLAECTKLVAHSCSGTALLPRWGGRGGGKGEGMGSGRGRHGGPSAPSLWLTAVTVGLQVGGRGGNRGEGEGEGPARVTSAPSCWPRTASTPQYCPGGGEGGGEGMGGACMHGEPSAVLPPPPSPSPPPLQVLPRPQGPQL